MDLEQKQQLERVADKIAAAILQFARGVASTTAPYFYADELRRHVERTCGRHAPGSADRVLRSLRQAGKLDYVVISRAKSLYEVRRVAP